MLLICFTFADRMPLLRVCVYALQLTRQSSVAYLASFLARGSFVDASLVSSSVQSLLDWAGQYLDQHADALAAPPQAIGTPGPKVCLRG